MAKPLPVGRPLTRRTVSSRQAEASLPAEPRAAAARHHGNRHRRSEEARLAVLQAADDLLLELGFAALTVEAIAARAGVGKQTIYRWWPSKTDILFDAFTTDAAEHFTSSDHGDLRADLRDALRQLAALLVKADVGATFRALAGQAQHDSAVAERFRADVVAPQRARDAAPFFRARARSELADGFDVEAAVDQLSGPVFYRALVSGEPLPAEYLDKLADGCLTGWQAD